MTHHNGPAPKKKGSKKKSFCQNKYVHLKYSPITLKWMKWLMWGVVDIWPDRIEEYKTDFRLNAHTFLFGLRRRIWDMENLMFMFLLREPKKGNKNNKSKLSWNLIKTGAGVGKQSFYWQFEYFCNYTIL